MFRFALVLLLALATPAFAFEGRPVSDLRFDGQASVGQHRVASDGVDFLLLSDASGRAVVQKVVDGRPLGPQRQIGTGEPAGLAWTGSTYLAAYLDGADLWVIPVSRDGSPLATPTAPVLHGTGFMTADHNGALAFAYANNTITVQRLDLVGIPVGSPTTYPAPAPFPILTAAPVAGGFGVVFSGFNGTWLMTFRGDGSAITPAPVLLDGPYDGSTTDRHSTAAAVGTNGIDTMVVFGTTKIGEASELKTAIVGANGVVKSVHVVHTSDDSSPVPFGLAWDGAQYIAAVSVRKTDLRGDPAFLRISSGGERVGDLTPVSENENAKHIVGGLGWNGADLIVPMYEPSSTSLEHESFIVSVDATTLAPHAPLSLGRTLTTQDHLTIEAVPGGYLAAWFERANDVYTVRASRLDAAGNYLDGEGIVLGATPTPAKWEVRTISIDVNGPRWFVVWTAGYAVRGRMLSHRGTPDAQTLLIGSGNEAAIRWNGTNYIVLRALNSLYSDTISPTGVITETRTIAGQMEGFSGADEEVTFYTSPALVLLNDRILAAYEKTHMKCSLLGFGCSEEAITLTGLFLETPDAVPFTIAMELTTEVYNFSIAASPTQALVTWYQYPSLRGALLPAGAPEQVGAAFVIDSANNSAVAFDGHDFVAAWWKDGLRTARITSAGAIQDRRTMSLNAGERGTSAVIAASPTQPALAGFIGQLASYDNVPRGVLVFANEIADAPTVPPAPQITCATRTDDGSIRVRWEQATNILGIAIELQLPDGTFRAIGVAPSDATTATVPLAGLEGSAVRIRSWNSHGVSEASAIAPSLPAPEAVVHASANVCAAVPFEVTASLMGTAPFVVRWSDGLDQTVDGHTATRQLTLDHDLTLSVVSVTDASCEVGTTNGGVDIHVTASPSIDGQTRAVSVARDQTTTLRVITSTQGTRFTWYEGVRGDTSHPVGGNASTFTTPPATRTMQYWVRLATACGSIDSAGMTVALNGRRRAVR